MKKLLFVAIVALVSVFTAQAQNLSKLQLLTSATVSNIFSHPVVITEVAFVNASTNDATVYFYDSSTAATSVVRAAYTSYSSYATNYESVVTNSAGYIYTNTFSGIYTAATAVDAVTNERPKMAIFVIPAATTVSQDVKLQAVRGVAAYPTESLTAVISYRTQ